jgi:hypothetical protein
MSGPSSPSAIGALSSQHASNKEREEEMPPAAEGAGTEVGVDPTQHENQEPPDQDEAVVIDFTNGMTQALQTAETGLNQSASEKVVHAMRSIFDYHRDIVDAKRIELARLTAMADHNENELREWQRVSIAFANAVTGQQPDLMSAMQAGA